MRTPKAAFAPLFAHPVIAGLALTLCAAALLAVLTPPITFNGGLGNDGKRYADLTEGLRGNPAELPWGPLAFRVLPSAFVAWMPFDIPTGFLVVNVLSVLGAAILLLRLLGRFGTPPPIALLALVWWLSLPMGLRWAIYYPVLGDAFGFFVLVALILCALERRLVLFAVALGAGVLARENLVMTIPFLWRAHVRSAPVRWTVLVALASVPAIAAFLLIRAFPPVAPAAGSGALTQATVVAHELALIFENQSGQAWRVLLAAPLSLGLLLVIPLLRIRATLRFLSREMHWMYFAALAVVLAVIGGRDNDRYFYVLAPLLLILTFAVHADLWSSWPRAAALTTLQLIALRVGWPIGTTEYDYLQYTTGFMELDRLFALALLMALVSAVAILLVRPRRGAGEALDMAPGSLHVRTNAH
jgi:hypothetical protein